MSKAEATTTNAEAEATRTAEEAAGKEEKANKQAEKTNKPADLDSKPASEEASSLLDEVSEEEKAENERILAAKDEDLSEEELAKKKELTEAKASAAPKSPEKYEFKLPEGMTIDEDMYKTVEPIFKEANISQETAQKLVDAYVKKVQAGISDMEKQAQANFLRTVEEMKQETIKSLGPDYKKELAFAAKARDKICSKELVEILNISGLANNKDVIGMFIKVGKMLSEDTMVEGKAKPHGEKSIIDVLYDADKK